MRGWALGLLGLSRTDFYEMYQGEFWEAFFAYRREKDLDRRHIGELVRGAVLRMWNILVGKKHRLTDPHAFWAMPWDEKAETAAEQLAGLTDEERTAKALAFLKQIDDNGTTAEG